jgi:hypothetical protein
MAVEGTELPEEPNRNGSVVTMACAPISQKGVLRVPTLFNTSQLAV